MVGVDSVTNDSIDPDEMRALLGALPDVVALAGPDRRIRYINRPQDGFTLEEIVGTDPLDFVHPSQRDANAELFQQVLETGEPASYEVPTTDADGNRQWYEGTLIPLVQDAGITGVILVTRNVTARRLAEEEAAKLRQLVPVCSWCKKVRTDEGYWQELESYIEDASSSRVTHSMCPECERKLLDDSVEEAG